MGSPAARFPRISPLILRIIRLNLGFGIINLKVGSSLTLSDDKAVCESRSLVV